MIFYEVGSLRANPTHLLRPVRYVVNPIFQVIPCLCYTPTRAEYKGCCYNIFRHQTLKLYTSLTYLCNDILPRYLHVIPIVAVVIRSKIPDSHTCHKTNSLLKINLPADNVPQKPLVIFIQFGQFSAVVFSEFLLI